MIEMDFKERQEYWEGRKNTQVQGNTRERRECKKSSSEERTSRQERAEAQSKFIPETFKFILKDTENSDP